jgi:diguanylate cyclase (GGDEF)-like protein
VIIVAETHRIVDANPEALNLMLLGRLGGEEFAITMIECDLQKAFAVSERLRERVANYVINTDGKDIGIMISVGVAELSGDMKF